MPREARRRRGVTTRGARTACLLLVLAAAACGGTTEEEERPTLPADLGDALAGRADAVAAHLDGGDPCGAAAEAEALVRETNAAVDAGRVHTDLEGELRDGARRVSEGIECPAEATEPPRADEEAPADPDPEPAPDDAQTLALGDAGEIEFRVVGDGLELVQVRPGPGWRHSASADEDEIDVDLSRGNRQIAVAIDAEGGGRLTLDVDYETGPGGSPQTLRLGHGGEVSFAVEGRTLRLLDVALAPGWEARVEDDEDKFEVEARGPDGSELSLVVEVDD